MSILILCFSWCVLMQSRKSVEFYIMNKIFTVFVGIMMRVSIIVGVVLGWFLGCVILLLQTSLIS